MHGRFRFYLRGRYFELSFGSGRDWRSEKGRGEDEGRSLLTQSLLKMPSRGTPEISGKSQRTLQEFFIKN